ncbi:hypothetical protein [Mucilaginibacter sp. SP1R1]|uniref:hypothetical protein n=1 Tax=Mucilaginibacter sp. SP1R1 TaxID=2723091 RepID=UPI001608B2EA|nr:hypothetical protein [Mucilaginibacter sp. SP1R1]MBB6149463.1 hypothetical protein [Mucilaginibacter sp. SP1R1]
MKNFKDLSVGDIILKAIVSIGKSTDETLTQITVRSIELTDKGNLLINGKYHEYGREWKYDLVIRYDQSEVNNISGLEKYPGFWFTDPNQANAHVRNLVINKIKDHESAIVRAKRDHLYTIELYRNKFYELLNPGHNNGFEIINAISLNNQ